MVEGQTQRDDGSDFQDDERDVLQSLPHQLQERLRLLWGDEILTERRMTFLQIDGVTGQTCGHKDGDFNNQKTRQKLHQIMKKAGHVFLLRKVKCRCALYLKSTQVFMPYL